MLSRRNFIALGGSSVSTLAISGCERNAAPARDPFAFSSQWGIAISGLNQAMFRGNANRIFPAASLAKIAIALATLRRYGSSETSMRMPVDARRSALVASSNVLRNVQDGDAVPRGRLLTLMLRFSDNRSANILIDDLGVDDVNQEFHLLGCHTSQIRGYYVDEGGHYATTSAEDVSSMLGAILRGLRGLHSPIRPNDAQLVTEMLMEQEDRDLLPAGFPCAASVANKTGRLSTFLGDAAIVNPLSSQPFTVVALASVSEGTIRDSINAFRSIALRSYYEYGNFDG